MTCSNRHFDNALRRAFAGPEPNSVELASGKVAELVKSFEHVTEILDGFRYQMGTIRLIQRVLGPLVPTNAKGLVH